MQKSCFYTIFFLKICDYKRTFNFSKKPRLRGFFTYFFCGRTKCFLRKGKMPPLGFPMNRLIFLRQAQAA